MADPSRAQAALLAICAAPQTDHGERLRALDEADWGTLCDVALRTRTSPLVVQAVELCGEEQAVPPAVFARLNEQARFHALGALQLGRDLVRVLGLLENHDLSPIVLKGVALAFRDYPDPALRPLRDLDLLLMPGEALQAQTILLADPDFERPPGVGQYGIDYGHQLPEILIRSTGAVIELHHRLNARDWPQEPLLVAAMLENAEPTQILGKSVRVPSAEDNFFHLIEHATLHHLFANGPLLLADLHYLTKAHPLDWRLVEEKAKALGLGPSLALIARIAMDNGAVWVPGSLLENSNLSAAHIATAQAAIFADEDQTDRQKMLERLAKRSSGKTGFGAALSRALQPDPSQLSRLSGHPHDSGWRWLGYPKWLFEKARVFTRAKSSQSDQQAAEQRLALMEWLQRG